MDFRFNSCGFWVLLQTTLAVISLINAKECRLCKPGYYASRHCTEYHDTVCKPCSKGTFSSVHNVFKTCPQCSKCDVDEFVLKPCSKHSDTVCESCSAITDVSTVTEQFIKDCLHYQSDQPGQSLDNTDQNDEKRQNPKAGDHVNVIYEGSGETIIEVSPSDKHKTVEEEGSGEIPVIDETDKNITSVILPDETETELTDTTTKKTGIVQIDDGIKLQNDTSKQKTDVDIPSSGLSTVKSIDINNGQGILISGQDTATVESVDVYLEDNQEEATAHYEYEPQPPHTGASKRQEEKSGGTSIGVVVTVGLVAALVFFILGFLASKFWNGRRERTFNVLEAERLNGKAGVECSGIEYKDSDNRSRNKTGIYDEIPANTKLNGSTADPEKSTDVVYSKPVKREAAQPTTAAPPPAERTKEPPQPERPVSEIKYIDEVDDTETDRLLQPSAAGTDVTNTSSSSSEKTETKSDQDSEKTPMLSKDKDEENS